MLRKISTAAILFIITTSFAYADRSDTRIKKDIAENKDQPVRRLEVEAKGFYIDRIYKSMDGPGEFLNFKFAESERPELYWLTGAEINFYNQESSISESGEYLCHSSLNVGSGKKGLNRRRKLLGNKLHNNSKLVDLVQGFTEFKLPKGFGIPIISNEPLFFYAMVNNNKEVDRPFTLGMKAAFSYIPDDEANGEIKPVFRKGLGLAVPVDDPHGHSHHKELISEPAGGSMDEKKPKNLFKNASDMMGYYTEDGTYYSYHWLVPPGRHKYKKKFNGRREFPFATTIHVVSVHLHAFGESLELRDLTTDKTVYKSRARNFKERWGIEHSDIYVDEEGVPVHPEHEYELVTVYNNTTADAVDAMAVMYLYCHNRNFDKSNVTFNK